ncbi:hypothetical protein RvY_03396-2 [Ramazzottius varieornatus]|uniref:Uncharacterized protein n=1 Tax=Ramazzottius varieornatus TaxID=947166 RepID=A0A1D1UXB0_RAMVA|nr:hypothetical protein RvY_03396-2 [Ramazzottius varieornatus]
MFSIDVSPHYRRHWAMFLVIISGILAGSTGGQAAAAAAADGGRVDVKSFACDYYSDGSNICFNSFRDAGHANDKDPKRLHGFNLVGEGEAVKGSWTVNDGFFSALDTSPRARKYIGTCKFESKWTCTGLTTSHDKEGSFVSTVGGGIFSGDSYTGRPGGTVTF